MKLFKHLIRQTAATMMLVHTLLLCSNAALGQFPPSGAPNTILRVDGISGSPMSGTPTGSDWGSVAFLYLQDAIDKAIDEQTQKPVAIWVRGGSVTTPLVYYPDDGANVDPDEQDETFRLAQQVYIYGGFAGTESSSQFNDRRPLERLTILSGDIDQDNALDADNSYHVVTADRVNNTALIDGFIVKHGNAIGSPAPETGVPAGGGGAGMQIIGDGLG